MAIRRNNTKQLPPKTSYKKNEEIRGFKFRLVGDNVEPGIYTRDEAMKIAEELGLDLILVNPKQDPQICKIADYGKLLYEEKRKAKEQEKKNRENKIEVKELRFGPNTAAGDLAHKANKAIEFLKAGDKVKLTVQFRGRQMAHKEIGERLLLEFITHLESYCVPEAMPQMEGRKMSMIVKPKKK